MGDSAHTTHHTAPGMTHWLKIKRNLYYKVSISLKILITLKIQIVFARVRTNLGTMGQQKRLLSYNRTDSTKYLVLNLVRCSRFNPNLDLVPRRTAVLE